jgi:methionyl-tRNA formyltransferase
MKVLLCAYHEAGYRALRTLVEKRCDVLVGTHRAPEDIPSVEAYARRHGLPLIVDDRTELARAARDFRPDVLFSVYYRSRLPQQLLEIPPLGAYNFHPSLLPRHRGCFSAQWAIIEGDRETGVTCHAMTESIDAGDIVDQVDFPIASDETGISLYYKLVDIVAARFPIVLKRVADGPPNRFQQLGDATYHPRAIPFDGIIDPQWSRAMIERFIRAMYFPPFPPAVVILNGVRHHVQTLAEYDRVMTCHDVVVERRQDHDHRAKSGASSKTALPTKSTTAIQTVE